MTSPANTTAPNRIAQIAVMVKDLPRAIRFYRDTLGLKFLFEAPPQMAFFDCGGVRLLIGIPEKPEFDHPASIIYYHVADIAATVKTLRDRGVEVKEEPHLVARLEKHDLWLAFIHDSEGNPVGLMSEVAR
jgi:predicted enzyme related to lactoylglutathione lyase